MLNRVCVLSFILKRDLTHWSKSRDIANCSRGSKESRSLHVYHGDTDWSTRDTKFLDKEVLSETADVYVTWCFKYVKLYLYSHLIDKVSFQDTRNIDK